MKLKTNIIHLVIVGVLSIGFISGCKEDPKYRAYLCPRCCAIVSKPTDYARAGTVHSGRCRRCGQNFGILPGQRLPFTPWLSGESYDWGISDAQAAKFLAEAKAEDAAKAKAEREIEELYNPAEAEAEAEVEPQ